MNKKVLVSLLLVTLLAFGAGLGTMAWFTDRVESTGNVFESGTLTIEGPDDGSIADGFLHIGEDGIGGIYPTWVQSNDVTVSNTGSLPFMYRVSAEVVDDETLLYSGDHGLQVKITKEGEDEVIYNGSIEDLIERKLGEIEAKEEETLTFTFSLPAEANNDYQGLKNTFKFIFEATQLENEGWEGIESDNGDNGNGDNGNGDNGNGDSDAEALAEAVALLKANVPVNFSGTSNYGSYTLPTVEGANIAWSHSNSSNWLKAIERLNGGVITFGYPVPILEESRSATLTARVTVGEAEETIAFNVRTWRTGWDSSTYNYRISQQ